MEKIKKSNKLISRKRRRVSFCLLIVTLAPFSAEKKFYKKIITFILKQFRTSMAGHFDLEHENI